MDSGSMHHFVGADSSCISWGHAQSGELGYGPLGQKTSTVPKKVDTLEGMHVLSVACGFAHSLVVIDRTSAGVRLEELEIYDGKPAGEAVEDLNTEFATAGKTPKKGSAKKPTPSKKRKPSDESAGESNGKGKVRGKRGRGKSTGTKVSGRGRGSTQTAAKSAGGRGTGKRGRTKKM